MSALVRCVDVAHRFGVGPMLFESLTFDVESQCVTGIIGPSGSGKSTLLAIISGLLSPFAGAVARDTHVTDAWLYQQPSGIGRRSCLDNVVLPMLAAGCTRREAELTARALLTRVGLEGRAVARFNSLSGGEAQRAALARALASAPTLLLLDEPTAQLDRATATEVCGVVRTALATAQAVVVATHDPQMVALCDVVVDLGAPRPRRAS